MIVADREGVGLQLLTALFIVHLVGDARRRRCEPRPPLAVALEFIVRHQLLEKLGRLFAMAEPLEPERLPLRAGIPYRQQVDRRRVRRFGEIGRVIGDPVRITVKSLHDRLADLVHGRHGGTISCPRSSCTRVLAVRKDRLLFRPIQPTSLLPMSMTTQ